MTSAVESLVYTTVVDMDNLKSLGYFSDKFRDKMVIAGTNSTATLMVEVNGAPEAVMAHATMLRSELTATPMEEKILASEKAVKKSLEELVRKTAPQSARAMRGRPTYTSIVAPPAT